MKPISPELQALLQTNQFWTADLYTFSIIQPGAANLILRYTGAAIPLKANGFTYGLSGSGPFFDRQDNKAKCHWKVGLEVDSLVFDVIPGASLIEGVPFLTACRQGIFDGAELTLERAFMPTASDTSRGTVIMFVGRVAEIDASRSLATFTVNSHLELLNQTMPRNLFQASCANTLYDSVCTIDRSLFAVSGTVLTGSTASSINATLSQASDYFSLGSLLFTSGANQLFARSVQGYTLGTPSVLTLISPLPNVPSAGDTFTVYPGCDKTFGTCATKFNNSVNFRGFPFIPVVETGV